MSDLKMDELQLAIIREKFSSVFKKISEVYNSPSLTSDLVNRGVAIKISQCYSPSKGYYLNDREEISDRLSEIKFTTFFSSSNNNSNDKKVFFLLKTPKNFLETTSSNRDNFIKYSLKKYCSAMSSEKLTEIYHKTMPVKITQTQYDLKQAILDICSLRGTLTNKLASIFDNKESKNEIQLSSDLKNVIQKSNHIVISNQEKQQCKSDLKLIKSVCAGHQ